MALSAVPLAAQTPTQTPLSATDKAELDSAIVEMARAYKQRDRNKLTRTLPQMRGYVLEPWAAYWELSTRLEEASPAEVQDFFRRYAGTYQEDKLREQWLLQLGRNSNWVAFNREFPNYRMGDDKSLRCYSLLADYLSHRSNVSSAVAELWLSLKDAEPGCSAAVAQLLKDGQIDKAVVWQRARLGMENDRPRVAVQALGLLGQEVDSTVNAVYQNPAKYLKDKLTALRTPTKEMVVLALIRLAALSPEEAVKEMGNLRWRAQLKEEERSWIWGVIGKRSAQKFSDDALTYFANGHTEQMHDDHLAWLARAALRAGKWAQVQEAIHAMSSAMQAESTWVYWGARALLAQNPSEATRLQAQHQLERIASTRGFYEQLAAEQLGQRITLPPRPAALTEDEKTTARANPGLARALYAIGIGLRSEGVREWNYSVSLHKPGGMDDRGLLAAADLACKAEVWDRCISSSERTKQLIDIEQRYPMPLKAAVLARCKQIGLDPAYVYGLIRQESRFVMDAKSGVGASGLMQVMPATARWTAKKIGIKNFTADQIADRDTNIAIGTAYLKMLLDSFAGSMPLAAAGYNAGPGRPRLWRGQGTAATLEAAIWAENIPFNETRDYVKKVLANTNIYATILSGAPQSLKARLGTIGPRDTSAPDSSLELP